MTANEAPARKTTSQLCEECSAVPSRYCCPACRRRTCSLACVNAHKASTGCTGKPSVTAYKSLKKFTDTDLVKDVRFLEEGSLLVDVAGRVAPEKSRKRHRKEKALPFRLHEIVTQAKGRGVDVEIMPGGMSRRQRNKTYFHRREKRLAWSVGLAFKQIPDPDDVQVFLPNVSENQSIDAMIRTFLGGSDKEHAVVRARLHTFRRALDEGERLAVSFVSESLTGGKHERAVDVSLKLSDAMRGGSVIEYPQFNVSISTTKPT